MSILIHLSQIVLYFPISLKKDTLPLRTISFIKLINMTVFIVEDDKVLTLILSRMMDRLGLNVIGNSEYGKESITQIIKMNPDLVLMDISLKDDIDGITVTKEIFKNVSPAVIYVTGNSDESNYNRAQEHGFHDFLIKPVSLEDLELSINKLSA